MSNANGTSEKSSSSGHGLGDQKIWKQHGENVKICLKMRREAHVHGILKDAMTQFKSMEGGAKYKYQKFMEVRDLVLNDRKELKIKIQVTYEYLQLFLVRPSDLIENFYGKTFFCHIWS